MSRTLHHVPLKHRDTSWWSTGRSPWSSHTLVDLRYPGTESARAHREGRHPTPACLKRTFASYAFPRASGTPIRRQREHEA
ncbi:hypothetical protein [Streptomyces sp. ISL-99]|uniref:hypothetical protein n=1 Tax=Streptomyces sp. ISL-99 TaxID=2819193 RepID=UPI00203554D8|nr:hypothetical protein [Streptomyces sp. ISL-99]